MRNYFIIALMLVSCLLNAQISIDNTDMPAPGDTFVISTAVNFNGDPELTGANYLWDFSSLTSVVQRIDSFLEPADVPGLYSLLFNNATVAIEMFEAPNFIPGVAVESPYEFFRNAFNAYGRLGIGVTLNGLPIPIVYDTIEIIYNFPLNYFDTYSAYSSYNLAIPTIGYFGEEIERESTVDGWGTLKLPMGDYEVLRVKSVITRSDTIYVDATGIGLALPPVTTTEYYWLGKGTGVPLFQVNQNALGISTAFYQDIYVDTSAIGIQEPLSDIYKTRLYPNPATDHINFEYTLESQSHVLIKLIDEKGSLIEEFKNEQQLPGPHYLQFSGYTYGLSEAVYYLQFNVDKYQNTIPFFFLK